jgi:hypothetical protein
MHDRAIGIALTALATSAKTVTRRPAVTDSLMPIVPSAGLVVEF